MTIEIVNLLVFIAALVFCYALGRLAMHKAEHSVDETTRTNARRAIRDLNFVMAGLVVGWVIVLEVRTAWFITRVVLLWKGVFR